jgi:hypothetical protein
VGLVGYPLQYFRVPGGSQLVLALMLVFFLWLIAIGVTLLRWQPGVVPGGLAYAAMPEGRRVAMSGSARE